VDDLVKILGVEVPVPPSATILSVTTDSVSLSLDIPERLPGTRYTVWANGESVADLHHGDLAFTITNLSSGQRYIIRIVATNASGYATVSDSIRISTEPAGQAETAKDPASTVKPSIVPCKALTDLPSSTTQAPAIQREHSGSFSKRHNTARRASPATFLETPGSAAESLEVNGAGNDNVSILTVKLQLIRDELVDVEKQEADEDQEFHTLQAELVERRESLRQQLKRREDESGDLRKTVASLEREHTVAQVKKTRAEKALSDLKSKREKLAEDTTRWQSEIPSFVEDTKRYADQKMQHASDATDSISAIRQEGEADQLAMRTVEEQIRQTGIRIKELEEEKTSLEEAPQEDGLIERQRQAAQEDAEWSQRLADLQARWHDAFVAMNQAQSVCQMAQQRLDFLSARHNSQMNNYDQNGYQVETEMARNDSQAGYQSSPVPSSNGISEHRLRHPSLQLRNQSTPSPALAVVAPTPFFNTADMLHVPGRSPVEDGNSETELEGLNGSGLASPSTGALLPKGLLGDDSDDAAVLPGPATPYLPGLGAFPEDIANISEEVIDTTQDLASPLSFGDRSPSLMMSAKNSISNFHQQKLSNGGIDSDRRSIRSVSSSIRGPARTGFRFGFQRARASSSGESGFPLGSLTSPDSRSLPRADEDPSEPPSTSMNMLKRRGGSSGGGGLFGSIWNKKPTEEGGTWPLSSISRPVSTYSTDNLLPRPSADALPPFGWNDSPGPANSSRVGSIVAYPWSAIPSRRTSINHEAAAFVPSNLHDLEMDSSEIRSDDDVPNTMAPIGTKPSKHDTAARLNPAARDFKSLLNFTGSSEKKDKGKKKATSETSDTNDLGYVTPSRSKENRISLIPEHNEILTDDSHAETSPAKSAETPSSAGKDKESFMRKMTRKGSSSKFSLPGSLFSRRNTSTAPSDDIVLEEDHALSNGNSRGDSGASAATRDMPRDAREVAALGMGRSLESVVSGGSMKSGFSLGSLSAMPGFGIGKRRAKKEKGKDRERNVEGGAPSISEASLASTETGDEGDMTGRESEDEFGTFGGRGEGLGRRTSVEEGW